MTNSEYINLELELKETLTTEQAWHYRIVPKERSSELYTFYIDKDKYESTLQDELEVLLGKPVRLEKTPTEVIQKTLGKYYLKSRSRGQNNNNTISEVSSGIDFVADLISEARSLDSSDIHFEISAEKCRVRMRIDGLLVERYLIDKTTYPAIINKIKILANLDISERRLPQDGRILFNQGEVKFDLRVSILPTLHGEKAVLRLLANDATEIQIQKLGFVQHDLENYLENVKKPHGMVLISGPTGSGKTTTLYATLKLLNDEKRNILTIEDPIEYTLDGINQVQLKESIGLTFASTLRTFLRQDPDIIMVGEIRDEETALMAVRAALTGHLVLSTIHTNSALGTLTRMADMGIPPFLISSTLNVSVAQRLIRKLCVHCKVESIIEEDLFPKSFKLPKAIKSQFIPNGCAECFYTGYSGRIAIYEVIPIDERIHEWLKKDLNDAKKELQKKGIKFLAHKAFNHFANGLTSLDEVYPILSQ